MIWCLLPQKQSLRWALVYVEFIKGMFSGKLVGEGGRQEKEVKELRRSPPSA